MQKKILKSKYIHAAKTIIFLLQKENPIYKNQKMT